MKPFPHARLLHSLRRRQQVIPDPQPISFRSISQGMPLFSTNRMPLSTARSSIRACHPWVSVLPGQERLDHFPQFVCHEFLSHTLTLPVTLYS